MRDLRDNTPVVYGPARFLTTLALYSLRLFKIGQNGILPRLNVPEKILAQGRGFLQEGLRWVVLSSNLYWAGL